MNSPEIILHSITIYFLTVYATHFFLLQYNDDADARNIKRWLLFCPLWKAIGEQYTT